MSNFGNDEGRLIRLRGSNVELRNGSILMLIKIIDGAKRLPQFGILKSTFGISSMVPAGKLRNSIFVLSLELTKLNPFTIEIDMNNLKLL